MKLRWRIFDTGVFITLSRFRHVDNPLLLKLNELILGVNTVSRCDVAVVLIGGFQLSDVRVGNV